MGKPEAKFQKQFIDGLKKSGFKCIRVKASGNVNKGKPDYAVFYKNFWAWLEFKKGIGAEIQPGQKENVEWAKQNSFGAFVSPETEAGVLDVLIYEKWKQDHPEGSQ